MILDPLFGMNEDEWASSDLITRWRT